MKTKTKNKTGSNKKQKKKIIVATVAVGAAGILGYFGWQYLKKKKDGKRISDMSADLKKISAAADSNIPVVYDLPKSKATATKKNMSSVTSVSSEFPLAKGSKGNNVRLLQEALIAKYGKSILPKYGADGDFGTET